MTRLVKWTCGSVVPPALIFLLGCAVLILGLQVAVITWIAVALPMMWSVVASLFILNLRPDGRFLIRNTFQPFLFFLFWCSSALSTRWLLSYFPSLGRVNAPGVEFVRITSFIYSGVIIIVVIGFVYQCHQDKRKKRIY